MKYSGFLLSLFFTLSWAYTLHHRLPDLPLIGKSLAKSSIANMPPLGKFLNPFEGCWQNAEGVVPDLPEQLTLPQLQAPVKVVYDQRLVPHIYAQNDHDLYFAQGYVTAFFRLWQMDFTTRVAAGRLSEVIGPKTLDFDRQQRRKGMVYAAENALSEMAKNDKAMQVLDAYTQGVNAYIQQLTPKTMPLEFKLLDYQPEPWTNKHIALLLKFMADDLAGFNQDLEMSNARQIFDEQTLKLLYPDFVRGQDPIVPNNSPLDFKPLPTPAAPPQVFADLLKKIDTTTTAPHAQPANPAPKTTDSPPTQTQIPDSNNTTAPQATPPTKRPAKHELADSSSRSNSSMQQLNPIWPIPPVYPNGPEAQNTERGSNNWAVAPSKTAKGHAILCNDPHLGLNLPAIWFEIQLSTPEVNTYGVSLPGSPCIVIGFNEHIAWGMTNAGRDVQDLYTISFRDQTMQDYWFDGKWRKAQKRPETIYVRHAATQFDTVAYTHYGPIYHTATEQEPFNLALKWQIHQPSSEVLTIYKLNRAQNYDDYYNALKYFSCPAQNFVFADTKGNIAIWQQGEFVNKWSQQGKYVMDGSKPDFAWKEMIPQSHNPHQKNPERGFVSSANQHPTDSLYPYYYNGSYEFYRNRRLNQQLSLLEGIDIKTMQTLQTDNYNLLAAEILPLMLGYIEPAALNPKQQKYVELLKNWDFYNEPDSIQPAIFEAWWDKTYDNIWDEIKNNAARLPWPKYYVTAQIMASFPNHPLMDIKSTAQKNEGVADIVNLSFAQAFEEIEQSEKQLSSFNWANYKNTQIDHLARIPGLGINYVHIGGNRGILNAASKHAGPSWRMIVEMNDTIVAEGIYPGGQSGNPGSRYYENFVDQWAAGQYYPLNFWPKEPPAGQYDILVTQNFVK